MFKLQTFFGINEILRNDYFLEHKNKKGETEKKIASTETNDPKKVSLSSNMDRIVEGDLMDPSSSICQKIDPISSPSHCPDSGSVNSLAFIITL